MIENCKQFVFDLDAVEAELQALGSSTVQFSRPLGDELQVVSPSDEAPGPLVDRNTYLQRLRKMCEQWGDRLTVRFYSYFDQVFDAEVLLEFPEIRSLMINNMHGEVKNLELIGNMPNIRNLHLGIYELDDKRLLEKLPIENLVELTIEESKTKALDLAPLADARALRTLRLFGHKKNIEAIGALSNLNAFVFNPSSNKPLHFLNGLASLRSLKFVLGGAESLAGLNVLPALEEIAFTMVRGLVDIGDLQRFPSLRRGLMQDQPQIETVRMGAKNTALQHLWFYNCPKLANLEGIGELPVLESLRIVISAIKLDKMVLPKSLTHLGLYSTEVKKEADERAAIEALGLLPSDHPDMPFFYK